ncbi:MAG: thioredoxin reductase [Solirubrobacteraceae bacterium]|nr:thioredoxin reductase [Solirubrobacteraceae bacterium]
MLLRRDVRLTEPLPETPDTHGAFPRLSEEQIAELALHGERRRTSAGEVLFREGDPRYDFVVVLAGKVAVEEGDEDDRILVAVHGPGRFLGELSLLTGQAAPYTAVVREVGEVLVVPVEELRTVVAQDAELGDLILHAYLVRRDMLIGLGAGFRIVGSRFSPDTRRLREFAARNRLPHRWVDLESDSGAEALLRRLGVTPEETPVVVWSGKVLRNPGNAALGQVLGLHVPTESQEVCDLIVVGAGPAGLAAAVYGASEGLATVTLDGVATGGQAATSSRIENYLGFPSGISGGELAERATIQAEKFGARVVVPARATGLLERDGVYVVTLEGGGEVSGRTVLIATGVHYRRLPVDRLEEFEGTSVYYAATRIEAQFCAGDPVAVAGGGNSAGQATVFLAGQTPHVTLIVRERGLAESMSRYLADRIERLPNVDVLLHTEVRELAGERALEGLVVEDSETAERRHVEARALFVFIGADPHTRWLGEVLALDSRGYVLAGPSPDSATNGEPHDSEGDRLMFQTSRSGVFAAGDVRSGSIKRVAAAVGEGSIAVRLVHVHLAERGELEGAAPPAGA